ncbi:MAG: hypothetical protein LBT53_08335 [Puniceicoccales bacterium]|jgi:hypothetical protein|nr:hypothetical protein [Puniceicoccales bacterium]
MSQTSDSASNSGASDTLAGNGVATSNLLDELYQYDGLSRRTRHYVLSDAMHSTTALVATPDGTIQQRLNYTAFGVPTFLATNFSENNADIKDVNTYELQTLIKAPQNNKVPPSLPWGDWGGGDIPGDMQNDSNGNCYRFICQDRAKKKWETPGDVAGKEGYKKSCGYLCVPCGGIDLDKKDRKNKHCTEKIGGKK